MDLYMSNEVLFLVEAFLSFLIIALLYRFMGIEGLYLWIPLSIFLANVTVLKQVNLFGINSTLGNVAYASSFLITDLLSEHYHHSYAKRVVVMGFLSFILLIIFTQINLIYTPSDFDTVQPALQTLFSVTPLLLVSSLASFVLSQLHDVWAYQKLKRLLPQKRFLWFRNNLSTLVSQLMDTFVFVGLATLFGIFPPKAFGEIFLSTYILKALIGLCDTPFLYLMSYFHHKKTSKSL